MISNHFTDLLKPVQLLRSFPLKSVKNFGTLKEFTQKSLTNCKNVLSSYQQYEKITLRRIIISRNISVTPRLLTQKKFDPQKKEKIKMNALIVFTIVLLAITTYLENRIHKGFDEVKVGDE